MEAIKKYFVGAGVTAGYLTETLETEFVLPSNYTMQSIFSY